MAKAQITANRIIKVEKEVPAEITLTLSLLEVQVLQCILGKIGGHPEHTPRGVSSKIQEAIAKLEIEYITYSTEPDHHIICFSKW